MSADLECPYCGAGVKICHDDGFGFEEDVPHEMDCPVCEKTFVFHTWISYSYHPEKADCLNNGEHEWGNWNKVHGLPGPRETQRRSCKACEKDEERTVEVAP
jgi:hypothetical protein